MSEYIGKRIIPRHDGVWDKSKSYESLVIVMDGNGDSYMSRRAVPAGTELGNGNYWAQCQSFSAQLKQAENNMEAAVDGMQKDNADTIAAVNKKCSETVSAVNKTAQENIAVIHKKCSDTMAAVTQQTDEVIADAEEIQKNIIERMESIEARQDANVTASTDSNADYAAEVVDARVDSFGATYDSLGDAIRSIGPYLEERGAEIVHEQMAGHYLDTIYPEIDSRLHQGSLNYDIYRTSTFSGWVSKFGLENSIRTTGITVYFKARDDGDPISIVRITIAKGERADSNIIFQKTVAVNIQPGESADVSCEIPGLLLEPGVYYIAADADVICSSGFGSTVVSTEYITWYTTEGQFRTLEKYSEGTKYQIAVELKGYNYGTCRADVLDSEVEALKEEDARQTKTDANLQEQVTALDERQTKTESCLGYSFDYTSFTDNIQNLIPGTAPYLNYKTSTFIGWASPIGPAKDFNTVVFHIAARAENEAVIDKIRCVVLVFDKAGEILADETQDGFNIEPGEDREIHFRLPVTIANDEGLELYAGFICDRYISVYTSSVDVNLNNPDYGKVTYISNGGTPPFGVDVVPTKWTDIYDPNLANHTRTFITVERQGKRYLLGGAQMEQVEDAAESKVSGMLDKTGLNDTQREEVTAIAEEVMNEPPRIILPDRYVAVVGDTLQLFYRGIIEHPYPYYYNIEFKCAIGKNTARYFEVTPTADQVKEYTLTVNVRDMHDNILNTAQTVLEVAAAPASPSSKKCVLCIGDSLTSGGVWCAEAYRRLTGVEGTPAGLELSNIQFIGTKKNAGAGYEGYGGWTWASYLAQPSATTLGMWAYCSHDKDSGDQHSLWKDADGNIWSMETIETGRIKFTRYNNHTGAMPMGNGTLTHYQNADHTADISFAETTYADGNPFWDADEGAVNFKTYCERNGFDRIDYVYTLLTWNGLGGYLAESDAATIANHVANAKKLIRLLHDSYPDAKVKVMGIQINSLNGGCGANYGANGSYSNWYGLVRSVMGMNLAYQAMANEEEFADYVEFINVSGQFDSEYNMPCTSKAVNTRSTATEHIGTNGVHPGTQGYYQIADAAFRNMCARIK